MALEQSGYGCRLLLVELHVRKPRRPGANAQQFPGGRPIEMTVMFGAGSAADVTARYLAEGMAKALGVPVPVVNRTGGGGAIGYGQLRGRRDFTSRTSVVSSETEVVF